MAGRPSGRWARTTSNILATLLLGVLTIPARAQSVCQGSFLGQGGTREICVVFQETGIPGGARVYRRGPSPLSIPNLTVGAYTLTDIVLTFSSGSGGGSSTVSAGGMALVIRGTLTRTAPGGGGLSITADGGLGSPLALPSNGLINLSVVTDDVTGSQLGGGAGYLIPDLGDVAFVSLGLVTCEVNTLGVGLGCEKDELPIQTSEPLVALRNITGIHLNDVGDSLTLPSSVGVGDLPLPESTSDDVIGLAVPASLLAATLPSGQLSDNVLTYFRLEEFNLNLPGESCSEEYWTLAGPTATSLDGITIGPGDCHDAVCFQDSAPARLNKQARQLNPAGSTCQKGLCFEGEVTSSNYGGVSMGDSGLLTIDFEQCQKTSNPAIIHCSDGAVSLAAGASEFFGEDIDLTVNRVAGEFRVDAFVAGQPDLILSLQMEGIQWSQDTSISGVAEDLDDTDVSSLDFAIFGVVQFSTFAPRIAIELLNIFRAPVAQGCGVGKYSQAPLRNLETIRPEPGGEFPYSVTLRDQNVNLRLSDDAFYELPEYTQVLLADSELIVAYLQLDAGLLVQAAQPTSMPAGGVSGGLRLDGKITVGPESQLVNLAAILNNNTINNFGILTNVGTIENNGVINNLCDGVVNNLGTISGNPVNQVPCSLYFAQFGDGTQKEVFLSSEISLLNHQNIDAMATIVLKDQDGQPLSVDLNGELVSGQLEVMIPAGSVRRFATDGLGAIQVGSVTVTSNVLLAGVILFESNTGFAGVQSSLELPDGFLAAMESRIHDGADTGVAIQNLEEDEVELELQLFDEDRNVLASAVVTLPAMGQLARFVSQFDWEPEIDFENFRGILKVTANGRLAATVILTRTDQFATLPVAPRD